MVKHSIVLLLVVAIPALILIIHTLKSMTILSESVIDSTDHNESAKQLQCPRVGPNQQYPCCIFERLPYVANLLETAQFLHLSNNSFVRFADGDIMIMSGKAVRYQQQDSELSAIMEEILTNPMENLSIGICDSFNGFSQLNKGYVQYYTNDFFRDFLKPRLRLNSSRAAGISGFIEPRTATPNPVIGRDVIETYYL